MIEPTSHIRNPEVLVTHREEAVAEVARKFADEMDFTPASSVARAAGAANAFFDLYPNSPVSDNSGGSGFNNSLWLYVIARVFAPALVVESGVFKGHISWVLRNACPDADIRCFDPDHSKLVYRDPTAIYETADWSSASFAPVDPEASLLFFDDHVSHVRRINEAYARGFRHLLFDDDFDADSLDERGAPPVPTVSMAMDPSLDDGREIRWTRKGCQHGYTVRAAELRAARNMIECRVRFPAFVPVRPDLSGVGLTYVRLAV